MKDLALALALLGPLCRWGYDEEPPADAGVPDAAVPVFAHCPTCCDGQVDVAGCVRFCEESKRFIAATCEELAETLDALAEESLEFAPSIRVNEKHRAR